MLLVRKTTKLTSFAEDGVQKRLLGQNRTEMNMRRVSHTGKVNIQPYHTDGLGNTIQIQTGHGYTVMGETGSEKGHTCK